MKRNPSPPVVLSLIVAIVYFAAAELGLSLSSLHSNVTPVWPPTGIAIASLLIFGRRIWPGIFAGALAANLLTNIPVGSSIGIAVGMVAIYLVLNLITITWGIYEVFTHADLLSDWQTALFATKTSGGIGGVVAIVGL